MTNLLPQAQAVLDAFTEDNSLHDWKHNHYNVDALAAALRAAAHQVVPNDGVASSIERIVEKRIHDKLLAIAAELENFTTVNWND